MTITDYGKLRRIVAKGPLVRGTEEWEMRELARKTLGCCCISLGSVSEANAREAAKKKKPFYHYMNVKH